VLTIVALACSRSGTDVDPNGGPHVINYYDSIAPAVEIYTPAADQVFTSGSNISITGKITDETGLYRGSVRVTNDANGELIREQLYEIHGFLSYNYTVNYIAQVAALSNYTITVSFEDHGLNTTSRSVKVKVNP